MLIECFYWPDYEYDASRENWHLLLYDGWYFRTVYTLTFSVTGGTYNTDLLRKGLPTDHSIINYCSSYLFVCRIVSKNNLSAFVPFRWTFVVMIFHCYTSIRK